MAPALDGEQPAVEQDGDAVGDLLDLAQDVRGQEHRAVLRQPSHQAAELDDLPRIEPVGRFVEHQQLGLVQHRLGQRHALPVAARQTADDGIGDRAERQPVARRRNLAAELGPAIRAGVRRSRETPAPACADRAGRPPARSRRAGAPRRPRARRGRPPPPIRRSDARYPVMMRRMVLLPEPLGPSRPITSRSFTSNETPSTAGRRP